MRISITAVAAATATALTLAAAVPVQAATLLAQATPPATQAPTTAGSVQVSHPWARPTAPRQDTGAAYLTLVSPSDDRLVAASTAAAERAEIHEMTMDNNIMRMRQVPGVALPAGQAVSLQPGGYHLMLIGLKRPLKAGDTFPLQLRFETGRTTEVQVIVERGGAPATTGAGHAGH